MPIYDWKKWSKKPLLELGKGKFKEVGEGPGIYAVFTEGKIHRVRGTDNEGLLYVGESGSLRWRVRAFYDCVVNGHETHVGGWRYNLVGLKKRAPAKTLVVRWFEAKNKKGAVRVQSEVLYAYVLKHCELPPLNYSLGRELMKEFGWRLVQEDA